MGIVNVTPDSFSDGGCWENPRQAFAHARALIADGAAIIDIGGESTRPGADPVSAPTETARVVPLIKALRAEGFAGQISIDTYHVDVAAAALAAGADMLNDISGFRDPAMRALAARSGADCVLMHMAGAPKTMQNNPRYDDVCAEVTEWLLAHAATLRDGGVAPERNVLDPGFGFGKTKEHNLQLLGAAAQMYERFSAVGYRTLIGISRKTFIGQIFGISEPRLRDEASAELAASLALQGADILRVHRVDSTRAALDARRTAPRRAWVALGANLGDTRATLTAALEYLRRLPLTGVDALATPVLSAPAYDSRQPPFTNTVCRLKTQLGVLALFAQLQGIECMLGRERTRPNGPRTIDVDLLAYEDCQVDLPGLTVPHPRLAERAFVVEPLLEIEPDFCLPTGHRLDRSQAAYGQVLNRLAALH
jgi:dihydropteroate synthase